jgi:hypothetical protein
MIYWDCRGLRRSLAHSVDPDPPSEATFVLLMFVGLAA